MDMRLNTLPTRTWNRLGINERWVTLEHPFVRAVPEAQYGGGLRFAAAAEPAGQWPEMKTGMGSDFAAFAAQVPADLLEAGDGVQAEMPAILNYTYQDGDHALSRLKIHAGRNSAVSVILLLRGEGAGEAALQTEIWAEEDARVTLHVVQLLGAGFTGYHDIGSVCGQNAGFDLTKLELGAGTLYAGVWTDLLGDSSHFRADVGYHVGRKEFMDLNYVALHHGKNTTSLMEVDGTLEEDGHKAFRGTIDFQKGCAGSKGTESEKVLLIGDTMINQTIPLILCKEEDVEGNHGASIGRLDDKVLFYLGTRGIPEAEAQKIISRARIEAICAKLPSQEIRELVQEFES